MNRFLHSGDLGDIISSLPAVRHLGGGEYVLSPYPHRSGGPREPMHVGRANFILPLLKAQSYITDARFDQKAPRTQQDFTTLRIKTRKDDSKNSLVDWHNNHMGISDPVDLSPWLKAEPVPEYVGKVVIARSRRYNNNAFPWRQIVDRHKDKLVFVGTREEHHRMLNICRGRLHWAQVSDALGMARIMAGASHVYANQSFPLWVAIGLGVPLTAECWEASPDVRIPRENARYFVNRSQNEYIYRNP